MVIDCSKYAGKCACGRVHTMETRAADRAGLPF